MGYTFRSFLTICLFATLLLANTFQANAASTQKYGALILQAPGDTSSQTQYKMDVGKLMGVTYQRTSVTTSALTDGSMFGVNQLTASGFKILLNINNRVVANASYSTPPSDLNAYKTQIQNIIDSAKPELVVIENEPLVDIFYRGTMTQYLSQLGAAVEAAHSKGVKVTDGGLTTLKQLVYVDYKRRGLNAQALDFANRVGLPNRKSLDDYAAGKITNVDMDESYQLINWQKTSNLDYVNFHWYVQDPKALQEAVDYYRNATGKPVITNEAGQYSISVPWIQGELDQFKLLNLDYVIWFSGDSGSTAAVALQNPDGKTLRPTGDYFKSFVATNSAK